MEILPIGEPMLETRRPCERQDLLGGAELIAVEVEDVDVPGAAELQVLQSELRHDVGTGPRSRARSRRQIRSESTRKNLLMTEPSTEEPMPVSHADQQRHQLLPLVSAASSFFRLGASRDNLRQQIVSPSVHCPGLPYVLNLRPRRHPRRRHQSPKGVPVVNNIIENSTTGVTTTEPARLSRSRPGSPAAAPIRMVHLGVGNFHRAHQAWYTAHAPDADEWGIAAFTGRRPDMAQSLAPQDGLYTLITRSGDGDTFELIGTLSAVHAATEHDQFLDYLSRPEVSIVTITVTEAGYVLGADRRLDADRDVIVADVERCGPTRGPRSSRCRPSWWPVCSPAGRPVPTAITDPVLRQPARERAVTRTVVERSRRPGGRVAARLDRGQRRLRHLDGGPDHPGHQRRRPGAGRAVLRVRRRRPGARPNRSASG